MTAALVPYSLGVTHPHCLYQKDPPWTQASTAEAALGALGEWFKNPASGSRHARKSQARLDDMWVLLRLTLVALQSDVTFVVSAGSHADSGPNGD